MGHDEISKKLGAFLDGEGDAAERAAISAHVADCSVCQMLMQELRGLSLRIRESGFGQMDGAVLGRIHARVETLSRRGVERFGWGLSAVAACLLVVASVQLMGTGRTVAVTPAAPAAWEGAAVQLSNNDEVAPSTNGEMAMAQWMVADLSDNGGRAGGVR